MFSGKHYPKPTCSENLTKKFLLWTKIRLLKVAEVSGSEVGSRTQSVNGTKRRPGNFDSDRALIPTFIRCLVTAWKRKDGRERLARERECVCERETERERECVCVCVCACVYVCVRETRDRVV